MGSATPYIRYGYHARVIISSGTPSGRPSSGARASQTQRRPKAKEASAVATESAARTYERHGSRLSPVTMSASALGGASSDCDASSSESRSAWQEKSPAVKEKKRAKEKKPTTAAKVYARPCEKPRRFG